MNGFVIEAVGLLVYLFTTSSVSCLKNDTIIWPDDRAGSKFNFTGMLLSKYSSHLVVSGSNKVYNLNASNLELLNTATIEPENSTVKLLIYNQTYSAPEYVTTCFNTLKYCSVRHLSDLRNTQWQLRKHVRNITGVQAFVVDSTHGSLHDSYLFVACPHFKEQHKLEGMCKAPGIFWFKDSGDTSNDEETTQGFESEEKTNVKTEKFVAAFPVEKLRIFFSIQKRKNGVRSSRIAQVCQYYSSKHNEYTTPFTYVDMPITCGEFQEVQSVQKVSVDDITILVAVFTDNTKSAICVYNMSHVNKTFVENLRQCYSEPWNPKADDYYFRYNAKSRPCGGNMSHIDLPSSDEEYLCNTQYLRLYHHMIGEHALKQEPVIVYDRVVTAITTITERFKVIAFLGTSDSHILKATVYPVYVAGKIKQRSHDKFSSLIRTMYTAYDQRHIFALTKYSVYKLPVESCSDFESCADCIGSKDPYCGWCMLENRCSERRECTGQDWIDASSTGQCPHIKAILPDIMSGRKTEMMKITMSHSIRGINISCVFENEHFTKAYTIPAGYQRSNNAMIECDPRIIQDEIKTIKGSATVKLSIKTPKSTRTIMDGYFKVFNCETFYSCKQCLEIKDACLWNTNNINCTYTDTSTNFNSPHFVGQQEKCPRANEYSVQTADGAGDSRLHSVNGYWYLSKDENYALTMTGTNLPQTGDKFSCKMSLGSSQVSWFNKTRVKSDKVTCEITKNEYKVLGYNGELNATIQFMWGGSEIAGEPLNAVIYECESLSEASDNCGLCKSYMTNEPFYRCKWCDSTCVYSQGYCNDTDLACPNPEITKVSPLSVAVNATNLQIQIEGKNLGSNFTDTYNSVTVAGKTCKSIKELYDPGRRIVCILATSNEPIADGKVKVTLQDGATGEYSDSFSFRIPVITDIYPVVGPYAGGSLVTVHGEYLDTGVKRNVLIGDTPCSKTTESLVGLERHKVRGNDSRMYLVYTQKKHPHSLVCQTPVREMIDDNSTVSVSIDFDGVMVYGGDDVDFTYVTNPTITSISPLKSFKSGGRNLTVSGTNLYAIQKPKVYAVIDGKRTKYEDCTNIGREEIVCPSPSLYLSRDDHNRVKRSIDYEVDARLGFVMDNVSSVLAENLPDNLVIIHYYPDPVLYNLTKTKELKEIQENNLVIKGERLDFAATREDVVVMIGCFMCNITAFTTETILCKPPPGIPNCKSSNGRTYSVQVDIGYLEQTVGEVQYESMKPESLHSSTEQYIVGAVMGVLVLCLIVSGIIVGVMMKKKRNMKREIVIKLDKLEANFRNQCREEFANLQTAVSDLTSDLEGGHVLFREYSNYADKTLFTSQKTEALKRPSSAFSEQTEKAMETFKGLLLNTQFLSMFIKTLEKQRSFTIHDKSNVATILMILNHDNMEYITGNLTSLLNDLVDKNITSGTPKLLLRRSESVAEKLLTHWLSICLYHHLKGKTGSSLYILYKAIKIQTEKGPIDYMTNCAKYTLSEDKLFTFGDKDIKPVTLALRVNHFDYIDNKEKQITVNVLDCDTITQTKSKMLDILYKNVPYSQRPSVHSTTLEVEEDGGGTKRLLNDEDASSVKDGLWKRINTLQHYSIKDGANVFLFLNHEMEQSCKSLGVANVSPESYIVGSFRKSRPAVRTISGSNFWHLTKKHQTDDDVPQASDLFLPRLTTTKMTLQPYIDQLFTSLLSMEDEPSIIIKYLFDFLDMAASRCGVTDPDVVHTWKCNSLLLRFWVNIIKNPEFVFDVHKPLLVDSCLSVVAQTLMDSCSTADLVVSKSSPSNKLLFAKDIPRYKTMVRDYFQSMKEKPAVSDQDLNSYLTQKVSQKFSGMFHTQTALTEMFNYAVTYKTELCDEMDNMEAACPGSFSPLSSKLQYIFMNMER